MQKTEKTKGYDYEVLLSIVLFLMILYFFTRKSFAYANLFLYVAFGLGFFSLLSKSFAKLLTLVWGKLMAAIGFVNSRVLLSIIFFLVLLPVSLLSKLFRKDLLQLKKKESSYFVERNHTYEPKDLENTW